MKQFTTFLAAFLMLTTSAFAQNNVKININHKLDGVDFAFNQGAKNNIGDDFNVTRLEYYISEISIVHDGGQETAVQNLWALVDATTTTQIDLGSQNITSVEGIKFHIGVDSAHNHLDPASYIGDHPLAPQFPSMHWGWASGYRFVAFEGNGGASYNQMFQLHALGDDNYYQTQIMASATAVNGEIIVNLNADYARALENISVNSGVIVHGSNAEAQTCLENFYLYVFSKTPTSTTSIEEIKSFKVFPNPTINKTAIIALTSEKDFVYDLQVTDILGRQIEPLNNFRSNTTTSLTFEQSGIYFIQLIKNGKILTTEKVLVH